MENTVMESLSKRLCAEFLGTFWLVIGGCGSSVLAAKFVKEGMNTGLGIGFMGVALAFGLTVVTGVYAFGAISGGHFNPAITLGLTDRRETIRLERRQAQPHRH